MNEFKKIIINKIKQFDNYENFIKYLYSFWFNKNNDNILNKII